MEHSQPFNGSDRLRDSSSDGDLTLQRRQAPTRTRRARASRSDRQAPRNRYRIFGDRMASLVVLFVGMSVLMPTAHATAPTSLGLVPDGVAPLNVLPSRPTERDSVYINKEDLKCSRWADLIIETGFKLKDLKTVDALIWRESRCLPKAHNTTLNADGSQDFGLMQINDRSWCLKNRYNPDGYLQRLKILNVCEDLFIPAINLEAAFALYEYSKGFDQWLP